MSETNPRLIELEDNLESAGYGACEQFVKNNGEELCRLRDEDAAANPTPHTALCCTYCGGTNVLIDAYARFNPITGEEELNSTHDNTVCNDCGGECDTYKRTLSQRELENYE